MPKTLRPVEETCRDVLVERFGFQIRESDPPATNRPLPGFCMAVLEGPGRLPVRIQKRLPDDGPWAFLQVNGGGSVELYVSQEALLFLYVMYLLEDVARQPAERFARGRTWRPAFHWHRPLFDNLLTQTWRFARHFDAESHIRDMARAGYTHVEVNALAQTATLEPSVPGEFYAPFYTYGVALDQFIDSDLNRGLYPAEYLAANLTRLKRNARLALKYGLQPGLLCFEPRSVPEAFFDRYPTLRGARVDHPFRSRKPRYVLALAHPLVREHYRQLMRKLLRAVPELTYLSIWSNDSGAGFEYTGSVYVGRNGGPYLIREWRTHEQIAEAAGRNVVAFLQLLQEAAVEINPDFRVSLRMEPFKDEHDVILQHLRPKLDLETPSLLARGYELPYAHPKYEDVTGVAGSVFQTHLENEEQRRRESLAGRGIGVHLIYSQGNAFNFEPLVGIPFPWLLFEKLQAMHRAGFTRVANLGGATPHSLAPFHINQEVFRAFQLDPGADVDAVVQDVAARWAGGAAEQAETLWRLADDAVRWFPILPLYSHFGFVWLRTWVRPIVPDLQAIPETDRRYYEDFMASPANNTNLVDLGRDVLFQLFTRDDAYTFVNRVDEQAMPRLQKAIDFAEKALRHKTLSEPARRFFQDQQERLVALGCWLGTQRATAAWVAGVYGYLDSDSDSDRRTMASIFG
ncbi:MAG: hypothetical protein Q9P14_15840 [candidate division KSB1 bacterium]|nr:hypothetical protein [candidate division KSB1 bacterium]